MSTNYSTTNQSYKHLSEAERGEIEAYLSVGLKPAEIARRLGRNRSTITREMKRGSITQVKQVKEGSVWSIPIFHMNSVVDSWNSHRNAFSLDHHFRRQLLVMIEENLLL